MDTDSNVLLLRWRKFKKRERETVVSRDDLEVLIDFGGGYIRQRGKNQAEGITVFTPLEMELSTLSSRLSTA